MDPTATNASKPVSCKNMIHFIVDSLCTHCNGSAQVRVLAFQSGDLRSSLTCLVPGQKSRPGIVSLFVRTRNKKRQIRYDGFRENRRVTRGWLTGGQDRSARRKNALMPSNRRTRKRLRSRAKSRNRLAWCCRRKDHRRSK